jgi:hypothetical protein
MVPTAQPEPTATLCDLCQHRTSPAAARRPLTAGRHAAAVLPDSVTTHVRSHTLTPGPPPCTYI